MSGSVIHLVSCILFAVVFFFHVRVIFFLSPADDDYSDTYNATYAVINNGETCFTPNETVSYTTSNFLPTRLSLPVWLSLPHSFSPCPVFNRWLQPVVQPHHGPPCAPDTYIQATRQKPLQQRRPSGAISIPCAPTSSAHAIHTAAEGQGQRPRKRLSWSVSMASILYTSVH